MPLTSLTSGLPFQTAWRATLLFVVVSALAGYFLVMAVESTLLGELRSQAETEATLYAEIYREQGRDGLVQSIETSRHTSGDGPRVAGLLDSSALSLAGPVTAIPSFVGTRRSEITHLTAGLMSGVYILSVQRLDQTTLVVGHSTRPVELARKRLVTGLVGFVCLMALTILALGLWASHRSLQRLEAMEHALRLVGEGDIDARLPVSGHDDQFDRVSVRVNKNLDLLARAVTGMKATVTAIAHDLKTPLTHVQISLHAAADAVENGGQPLPGIENALRETEELNNIFDSILRITRIRAIPDRSRFSAVSLVPLAEKSIEFLKPSAEENGQTLNLEMELPLPVHGDDTMILQAIINLLKNAVVHAGAGARITVRIAHASISVRDNGPGVNEADLERLFDFFARGDATRGTDGSGLGLALVKAVADHHEARLQLENLSPGFRASLDFPENHSADT